MRHLLMILLALVSVAGVAGQVLPRGAQVLPQQVADRIAPDRIRSTGGRQLNPTGSIPASGFRAFYFDRDNPGEVIFQENVESVAISYAWSDFHRIPSPRFGAYWVGRLHFDTATIRQFSVSQSWARSRVIIDGQIVFDRDNQSNSFTHEFAPGEHIVEVEYINNWHTVEYRMAIDEAYERLTEDEVAARLRTQGDRVAGLYYVGFYESGSRDTSVRVTMPPEQGAVILWLTSYEAIDWNIDGLQPGSTVVVSAHAPGSRVRGPGVGQVIHMQRGWSIHSESRRCSCAGGHYHCEYNQDLNDVADRLRGITGMTLSGYALAYSAPRVIFTRYDDEVGKRILDLRRAAEAGRNQCQRNADPDFDRMMD